MYRYSNGQISLADLKQPVGMNLKESNRWVALTLHILDDTTVAEESISSAIILY